MLAPLHRHRAATVSFEANGESVPPSGAFAGPRSLAVAIGAGRLAIGAAFLAAPVASVRVLGVDTATAKRMSFLARMAAARDLGLGLGTLAARTDAAPWLLVGALADGVDAVAIGAALRRGSARGVPAMAVVAGAAAAAVTGVGIARALRRG